MPPPSEAEIAEWADGIVYTKHDEARRELALADEAQGRIELLEHALRDLSSSSR